MRPQAVFKSARKNYSYLKLGVKRGWMAGNFDWQKRIEGEPSLASLVDLGHTEN